MKHIIGAALTLCVATAACGAPAGEARTPGQQKTALVRGPGAAAASALLAVVYKTPTCGCCAKWVEHLQSNGYKVEVHDVESVEPTKAELGVPGALASCHTAKIGGYVFEGHVPADVIQRVLREKPQITGVAVPGMPMGSPGMEGPTRDHYDIVAFDGNGHTSVYESR